MKGRKGAAGTLLLSGLLLFVLPLQALAVDTLVPMGCAVGIELETDGVMVAGFSEIETENGVRSPAAEAGMKAGDVITAVGERRTDGTQSLLSALTALDGSEIAVTARRDGHEMLFHVLPAKSGEGRWQLGLWLREGVSGIGTVTYYDPESHDFGALGHGISDLESGKLLPFDGGTITDAAVVDVVKGAPGAPGELCGQPDPDRVLGALEKNTGCGIFGKAGFADAGTPVPVASPQEVRLGPASILATVNGSGVREYSVEISRIYRQPDEHRFLMLTVTDPELLAQTGGIVQGMSGSPILQDGKLIGAVTHVLLSDATRGYGIGIRDMLDAAA